MTHHSDHGVAPDGPPRWLRLSGLGLAAMVGAGALWLIAVRGETIIVDLATLAGKVWCF